MILNNISDNPVKNVNINAINAWLLINFISVKHQAAAGLILYIFFIRRWVTFKTTESYLFVKFFFSTIDETSFKGIKEVYSSFNAQETCPLKVQIELTVITNLAIPICIKISSSTISSKILPKDNLQNKQRRYMLNSLPLVL